jgi:hypothetical protein
LWLGLLLLDRLLLAERRLGWLWLRLGKLRLPQLFLDWCCDGRCLIAGSGLIIGCVLDKVRHWLNGTRDGRSTHWFAARGLCRWPLLIVSFRGRLLALRRAWKPVVLALRWPTIGRLVAC